MPGSGFVEWLQNVTVNFSTFATSNPLIGAAMTMWGLTVMTFLLKGVPFKIIRFIIRQSTTTLTFTNQNIGTNMETFGGFMNWFNKNQWSRFSREIAIDGVNYHNAVAKRHVGGEGTTIGPGNGLHFFLYKGWPFWMRREVMASNSSSAYQINYEITITAVGRRRERIMSLIEEFRYRPEAEKLSIFNWAGHNWEKLTEVPHRRIETVIVEKSAKEGLIELLDRFYRSESWYKERGLPYKCVILLHGPPGGGKTSLIKALASHYQQNICQLSLSTATDEGIYHALATTPKESFVVIEDCDSSVATRTRKTLARQQERSAAEYDFPQHMRNHSEHGDAVADMLGRMSSLTLSGLLNALDGIISLDGNVIFLSTNVPEELDPAITRKGRIDHQMEVAELQQKEIQQYITLMFPDSEIPEHIRFNPIMGCDLQDLYFRNNGDVEAFMRSIPSETKHLPGHSPISNQPDEVKRVQCESDSVT